MKDHFSFHVCIITVQHDMSYMVASKTYALNKYLHYLPSSQNTINQLFLSFIVMLVCLSICVYIIHFLRSIVIKWTKYRIKTRRLIYWKQKRKCLFKQERSHHFWYFQILILYLIIFVAIKEKNYLSKDVVLELFVITT